MNNAEFETILDQLNENPRCAVSVYCLNSNAYLFRNLTSTALLEQYQSAENLFESLFANNHHLLQVVLKEKNGSTYKTKKTLTVNFLKAKENMENNTTAPVPSYQQPLSQSPTQQLGLAEYAELYADKRELANIRNEYTLLKQEHKEAINKVKAQEEELLRIKYNADNKASNAKMIAEFALPAIEALKSFRQQAPIQPAGLAMPHNAVPLSEAQKKLFATAKQLDDTSAEVVALIAQQLNTNADFTNDILEILIKHNLWQQ